MPGPVDIRAQAATVVTGLNALITDGTLTRGQEFHAQDYTRAIETQPASGLERAFSVRIEDAGADSAIQSSSLFDHEADLVVEIGYERRKDGSAVEDMIGRDTMYLLDRMQNTTNYAPATTGLVHVWQPRLAAVRDLDERRRVVECRWRVRYRVTRV